RHLVGAADFGFQVVNPGGESVRRKPFGHRVRVEERPIDFLWRCTQHPVQPDGIRHFVSSPHDRGGTLIIHPTPKRSVTMPTRGDQNVFPIGICTCPRSARAANILSARVSSAIVMESEKP